MSHKKRARTTPALLGGILALAGIAMGVILVMQPQLFKQSAQTIDTTYLCGGKPKPTTNCPITGQQQVCKNNVWTCGVACTPGNLGQICTDGCRAGTGAYLNRRADCTTFCDSGSFGSKCTVDIPTNNCQNLGGSISCVSLSGASCSGYKSCSISGNYEACEPLPGTNQCRYELPGGGSCTGSCPAAMPPGMARCQCSNGQWTIGTIPAGGSCATLCGCTGNVCTGSSCTPKPTPTRTPPMSTWTTTTPTPRTPPPPTRTPTSTPRTSTPTATPRTMTPTPTGTFVSSSCTNWIIDEHSGTGSNLAKIDAALTNASGIVKFYDCFPTSTGVCDFENMDSHPTTGVLYAIPNRQPSTGPKYLYTINTKSTDTIPDGTLTRKVALDNRDLYISSISFRRSDGSLWAWARGKGLYKIDIATGKTTLMMASTLTNVEGIAWDNGSRYIYASRTPQSTTPRYASFELHQYDVTTNRMVYYAPLPGFTDEVDFAPTSYLNGYLVGMYRTGADANTIYVYTYNVATKSVVRKYAVNSPLSNNDSFAVCVPN